MDLYQRRNECYEMFKNPKQMDFRQLKGNIFHFGHWTLSL